MSFPHQWRRYPDGVFLQDAALLASLLLKDKTNAVKNFFIGFPPV
jgi:hypothetical protein